MKLYLLFFVLKILNCVDYCTNLQAKSLKECIFFSDSNNNCCFNKHENKCILQSKNNSKNINNNILCDLIDEWNKEKIGDCTIKYNGFTFFVNKTNEKAFNDYEVNGVILNCNFSTFLNAKILIICLVILLLI